VPSLVLSAHSGRIILHPVFISHFVHLLGHMFSSSCFRISPLLPQASPMSCVGEIRLLNWRFSLGRTRCLEPFPSFACVNSLIELRLLATQDPPSGWTTVVVCTPAEGPACGSLVSHLAYLSSIRPIDLRGISVLTSDSLSMRRLSSSPFLSFFGHGIP